MPIPHSLGPFHTGRESTLGQSLFDLGNGQWDIPELRRLLADVLPKAAAVVGYHVEHEFPDLGQRTMLVTARRLSHPGDNSSEMMVVFEDVTESERADAAKDLLLAETRHRMKNLIAILRAVAHQTDINGRTGAEYRDVFLGRFEAVLRAQDIITARAEADLASLISGTLGPLASADAVKAEGPVIRIAQYQVVPVTMIVHELATNALKYGALSRPTGVVHINWKTEQRDNETRLLLDWHEQGGPVVTPPIRRGFGTELIEFSIKAEGGEAVLNFDPDGLRVRLVLPLSQ